MRVGLRYSTDLSRDRSGAGASDPAAFVEGPLQAGSQRFGAFGLTLALDASGDEASFDLVLENRAEIPLHVESVVIGLRWVGAQTEQLRFLRHGWQSWSFTGGAALDEAGEPPFPSGAWLRGLFHGVGAPPADRAGWHESDLVSVAADGAGAACLAGTLERGRGTSFVYWKREPGGVRVEVEVRFEVPLAPGASLEVERVRVLLGVDENVLLERFAAELGARNGARVASPFQAGWCSWYQFFHGVREDDVRRSLDALTRRRSEFPIDLVQLDDGYQRAIGDWLETNDKFPRGLAPLAREIRAAGFRAGIWTAPFCVVPESELFARRPNWLLREGDEPFRALLHFEWTPGGKVFALDTSQPEVRRHLLRLFAALAGMGFSYLKLDFLYAVAMQADAADPEFTRAQRLRAGLEAIREGAGDEAFLLGCGCPIGPAVGLVDGMRVGPDVAPRWRVPAKDAVRGIEATQPSLENALRNTLARAWMHRRLWLNDPDCLMTRAHDTELTRDEVTTLAGAVAASGGMLLISDDVASLDEAQSRLLRETAAIAREVDASASQGAARALDLLGDPPPRGLVAQAAGSRFAYVVNWRDEPARVEQRIANASALGALPPLVLLGTQEPDPTTAAGVLSATLPAHASLFVRAPAALRLAVFCDYDGTFALQDVGSTLARIHAAERRPALWKRLEAGELTAWEYNLELLDRIAIPEEVLEAFLRTVEPDPGAHALVNWCESHGVPFRVLSDGFDRNLDRLQELHGVRFAYVANRLWYEESRWRIAAGRPDASCGCGTGVCKAACIRDFRTLHPRVCVVHVGNGKVSDLCGARAADVVFAKDSLAAELAEQGMSFEPFETLHDVVQGLELLRRKLGG